VASFRAEDGAMSLNDNSDTQPVAAMAAPPTPAVVAERLVREFDGVRAVDEVDLEIARGEIYGFLGPNGAGKSTMVRMLCTLLSPTAGRAVVAGHDVATQPDQVRLRIGVALQEAALDPKQTGLELLRLQGRLYGLSGSDIDRRLTDLRDLIDIGDALGRRIGTYSGGMKRRLDLAAALVHNPEVLFLDEPTTGLDPVSRARMWEEVRRLNRELEMTIFLTTQYLEEADQLCDRIAIIDGGVIVREGTPAQLKAELRERRGLESDPTLDDVFLDATGRTRVAGDVQEVSA
jgi:ABC-2 type transport system ATP-binding protein